MQAVNKPMTDHSSPTSTEPQSTSLIIAEKQKGNSLVYHSQEMELKDAALDTLPLLLRGEKNNNDNVWPEMSGVFVFAFGLRGVKVSSVKGHKAKKRETKTVRGVPRHSTVSGRMSQLLTAAHSHRLVHHKKSLRHHNSFDSEDTLTPCKLHRN